MSNEGNKPPVDLLVKDYYEKTRAAFKVRAFEMQQFWQYYLAGDAPHEKELARLYEALRLSYTQLSTYFDQLLFSPLGLQPPDLNISVVYERLSSDNFALAHLHERIAKREGKDKDYHKELERLHRAKAHDYIKAAEKHRNLSREDFEKSITRGDIPID